MATTRIGISGWRYEPWRGTFYPKDLPQRAELEYASAHLPVIEINGSFYSLQRPESYASWYADTPADFMFTVKGPRFITHMRRLQDVGRPRQLSGFRECSISKRSSGRSCGSSSQLQVQSGAL